MKITLKTTTEERGSLEITAGDLLEMLRENFPNLPNYTALAIYPVGDPDADLDGIQVCWTHKTVSEEKI